MMRVAIVDDDPVSYTHLSMPVSDIAKKLGFSSSTFFTRTFKQYMHTTPTAYRRNMLK